MDTDRPAIGGGHGGARLRHGGNGVEQLLTLRDLAQTLQVSETTIRRMVAKRRLPCLRVGRQLRFAPDALSRWLSAREEG